MRKLALALILVSASAAFGAERIQVGMANDLLAVHPELTPAVTSLCGSAILPSDAPEVLLVKNQVDRIGDNLTLHIPANGTESIAVAVYDSNVINAFTHSSANAQGGGLVCIPSATVKFFSDAPEELGFIIGHELGHALDEGCRQIITNPNRMRDPRSVQNCESRADAYGLAIVTAAGYSPFVAAGAFGRLEMYLGDTSTGIMARFQAMSSDHPMTPDRIANMRKLLLAAEGRR